MVLNKVDQNQTNGILLIKRQIIRILIKITILLETFLLIVYLSYTRTNNDTIYNNENYLNFYNMT